MDGTVDDMKQRLSALGCVATALVLIVGAALIDAIPPQIASPQARQWCMTFLFAYKGGASIVLFVSSF